VAVALYALTVAVALLSSYVSKAKQVGQFQVYRTPISQDRLMLMFDVDLVICSDDTTA